MAEETSRAVDELRAVLAERDQQIAELKSQLDRINWTAWHGPDWDRSEKRSELRFGAFGARVSRLRDGMYPGRVVGLDVDVDVYAETEADCQREVIRAARRALMVRIGEALRALAELETMK